MSKEIENILFGVYEKGVKQEDCDLTEVYEKLIKLLNLNKDDDMRIECLIGETYQVTDGSTVWFQGRLSDCKAYLS